MRKRPKGIEPGSAGSAAACAISIDSDDDPDPPPPKTAKQQQEPAVSEHAGSSSQYNPARRSAKDRMTELTELKNSGLISEQDFENKKKSILDGI